MSSIEEVKPSSLKRKRDSNGTPEDNKQSVRFNPDVLTSSHGRDFPGNQTVFELQDAEYYKKRKGRHYILDPKGRRVSSFDYSGDPNVVYYTDKQSSAEKNATGWVYLDEQANGIFVENKDGTSTKLFKWEDNDGKKYWCQV